MVISAHLFRIKTEDIGNVLPVITPENVHDTKQF